MGLPEDLVPAPLKKHRGGGLNPTTRLEGLVAYLEDLINPPEREAQSDGARLDSFFLYFLKALESLVEAQVPRG